LRKCGSERGRDGERGGREKELKEEQAREERREKCFVPLTTIKGRVLRPRF